MFYDHKLGDGFTAYVTPPHSKKLNSTDYQIEEQ